MEDERIPFCLDFPSSPPQKRGGYCYTYHNPDKCEGDFLASYQGWRRLQQAFRRRSSCCNDSGWGNSLCRDFYFLCLDANHQITRYLVNTRRRFTYVGVSVQPIPPINIYFHVGVKCSCVKSNFSNQPLEKNRQQGELLYVKNGTPEFVETLRLNRRLALFALFLLCGLLVFVAPHFLQNAIQVIAQICIAVAFLLFAVWLRLHEPASKYFYVSFAFFIGSFVTLLENLLQLSGLVSFSTVAGTFFYQIMSTLVIVIPIVLLTKISGTDMGGIYLQRGRLRLGLLIGLGTFLFMLILILAFPAGLRYASMLFPIKEDITYERVLSLMPIVVIFVLLNGFKEELWVRGIFLKKFEAFLGAWPSNILAAFVFAVAHSGVTYTPVLLIFLGITFLLGLAWGYVMQKTDSIIGSALFHGAMDIAIILGIFSNL